MHQVDFNLSLEEITKVEGHARLDITVRGGKVVQTQFQILEYKRFYTQAIRGQAIMGVPQLLARICGTCSNAHLMASIEAIEHGLGIIPSPQTMALRRLTVNGLIIRDHALHLYLFVMPDLFNRDSLLQFDEKNPEEHEILHDAFAVKSAGNHLSMLVAGRSVHAPYPTIGGFLHTPEKKDIPAVVEELQKVRPAVLRLIDLFMNRRFVFERKTQYVALLSDTYGYLEGELHNSKGVVIPEQNLREHLEHVVVPYSEASAYIFEGEMYRVGALSRMNLAKEKLHPATKRDANGAISIFPSDNVHDMNLAQAIEILQAIDESLDVLKTEFLPEMPQKPVYRESVGIGVVEAPRGVLFHKLYLTADGKVREGEVIVPTGQNQIPIERDIAHLVEENITMEHAALSHEIEKLIRAYDPCMSCAAHFLEVNWLS
ncbi:MAG: nickel-dependent hydrogenase large subunit [bacterium]|nr:nickel-dependent hydrogenase large subunit [bacterium]